MSPESNGKVICWSGGQKAAFEQLLVTAETFFEQRWSRPLGTLLKGRFDTLVVGGTGVGKSHLVRAVSRSLGIPLLRISSAEWVVMAARDSPRTLERIHAFVSQNQKGIIQFDELDKFRSPTSDWSVSVMVEAFQVLDRSLLQPMRELEWSENIQSRLADSIWMVGTGTWQAIWSDVDKPKLGFRADSDVDPRAIQKEIIKRAVIPTELLRRFRSELVIIPPPTEADYRNAAKLFGLQDLAEKVGVHLNFSTAVECGQGARWLEEQLANILCSARKRGVTTAATTPDQVPEDDWLNEDMTDALE